MAHWEETGDAANLLKVAEKFTDMSTADVPSELVGLIWAMDPESETAGQKRHEKLCEPNKAIIETNILPTDMMMDM
ncbi:hypothetical protein BGX23_008528 [Mortierella sp. AD031]|nr:hypothetical protein BGX23_008528 [Mortierella sp. AD031]